MKKFVIVIDKKDLDVVLMQPYDEGLSYETNKAKTLTDYLESIESEDLDDRYKYHVTTHNYYGE